MSFISLTRVLRAVSAALAQGGEIVALVKPQFEADPADAPKGVVRDEGVRLAMVERVVDAAREIGLDRARTGRVAVAWPTGQRRVPVAPGADLMRRFGLAFNPTKPAAMELCERATSWLSEHDAEVWALESNQTEALVERLPGTEGLIVLGGDGTFLRAARALARVDVPVLGVNSGRIGFLSKIEPVGARIDARRI